MAVYFAPGSNGIIEPNSGPVNINPDEVRPASCSDFGEYENYPDTCPEPCSYVTQSNHFGGETAPNGRVVAGDPNGTPSLYCYKCNADDANADCASFDEFSTPDECPAGQTSVAVTHSPGEVSPGGCVVSSSGLTCYKCVPPANCADFGEYEDANSCPHGCMYVQQSNHHGEDIAPNGAVVAGDPNNISLYCYECLDATGGATCSDFGESSSPGNCNPGQTSRTITHVYGETAPNSICVDDPAGLTCYDCYNTSSISNFNNYFNNA